MKETEAMPKAYETKHRLTDRPAAIKKIEKDHGCDIVLWHDRVNPSDDYLAIILAYIRDRAEFVVWGVNREALPEGGNAAACFTGDYIQGEDEARCKWAARVYMDVLNAATVSEEA